MKLTKEEKKEIKAQKKSKRLSVINEFKAFIMRGNVIDMAVGVIVATAFTQIVSSLTNGIFMPFITYLVGDIKFDEIKTILRHETLADDGTVLIAEVALKWGVVIANVINFLLIALIIFTTVKIINRIRNRMAFVKNKMLAKLEKEKKEAQAEEVKAEEVEEVKQEEVVQVKSTNELLEEIIELLKNKQN